MLEGGMFQTGISPFVVNPLCFSGKPAAAVVVSFVIN
jgi:hypothetical protein